MGNFSINHYSRIEPSSARITIHSVLDYAEIPTFQLLSQWGMRTDSAIVPSELQPAVEKLVAGLQPGFRLLINGSPAALQVVEIKPEMVAGAGGLFTLRISFDLMTNWKPTAAKLQFFDDSYRERIGWREIVVAAEPDFEFPEGNSFAVDRSAGLTRYPTDMIAASPNMSSVAVRVALAAGTMPPRSVENGAVSRENPTP